MAPAHQHSTALIVPHFCLSSPHIVHALKEAELADGPPSKPRRPRALVLAPTRELTDQIFAVAKSLSRVAKFRAAAASGSADPANERAALDRPIDVLVGTPRRVAQHAAAGRVFYGDVQVVVLDEADTMLDEGFGPEVRAVLAAVRGKPGRARCVLAAATAGKKVKKLMEEEFPGIKPVETSSLHRGVSTARHTFLPVVPGSDKIDMLAQLAEADLRGGRRAIVFCNTLSSCRAVDHGLTERGLATLCYHGDVPSDDRRRAIKEFSGAESSAPTVLVATDLAARGLDVPGGVDHVINFDFPLSPVDYLHRAGRTARAGAKGKITSLVAKGDKVLAQRVEEALGAGLPLDQLSSDRAVLPPHMQPKPETLQRRALEKKAENHSRRGTRGAARDATGKAGKEGSRSGGSGKEGGLSWGGGNGGSMAGPGGGRSRGGSSRRPPSSGRSKGPKSFKK
jgi:superfamily II DNA/RNA helicase